MNQKEEYNFLELITEDIYKRKQSKIKSKQYKIGNDKILYSRMGNQIKWRISTLQYNDLLISTFILDNIKNNVAIRDKNIAKTVTTNKDVYEIEMIEALDGSVITKFISSKNGLIDGMWKEFTHGKGVLEGDLVKCCKKSIEHYESQANFMINTNINKFEEWDGNMKDSNKNA